MKLENLLREVRQSCNAMPALIDAHISYSYGELDEMVARCASGMKKLQYTILIHVDCRIKAIVLMLAAIESRLPFVPVDRDKSPTELEAIRKRFRSALLISDVELSSGAFCAEVYHSDIESFASWETALADSMSVMFTSGTTGTPKGVLVPAEAVINLLHQPTFFPLCTSDVFATYSPLSFDASTFEIFTPLLNGNTLVIIDKTNVIDSTQLKSAILRFGISCMWMTAGLFNQLVKTDSLCSLTQLNTLIVGGDKVDYTAALTYVRCPGAGKLFNGYGPTENTVFTTVAPLTYETLNKREKVPIGHAVPGVECLVWDIENDCPAADGAGRLLVSGKGLSRGYFNDSFATDNAFITLRKDQKRYYDTGDHVQLDRDGTFYFVGRTDRQVKLNGHRVELGDIEARLERSGLYERVFCTLVDSALVIMLQLKQADTPLVNMRANMKSTLHDYEFPKWLLTLTTLDWPLTGNNKLDVKALQRFAESRVSELKIAQDDEGEKVKGNIQRVAEKVLCRPLICKRMGLFDIGFDSINIAQFQHELCKSFNIDIGIIDIYSAGTLENIERLVEEKAAG